MQSFALALCGVVGLSAIFGRQAFNAGMTALITRGEHIKRKVPAENQRHQKPAPVRREPLPQCSHGFVARGDVRRCYAISARPLFSTVTLRVGTVERKVTILPSIHISVRMVSPG